LNEYEDEVTYGGETVITRPFQNIFSKLQTKYLELAGRGYDDLGEFFSSYQQRHGLKLAEFHLDCLNHKSFNLK
jgi:hypothetical protein